MLVYRLIATPDITANLVYQRVYVSPKQMVTNPTTGFSLTTLLEPRTRTLIEYETQFKMITESDLVREETLEIVSTKEYETLLDFLLDYEYVISI